MTNEFRQVEPTVGDARRRRCTTERKLQIIEERYPRGDGFLCGAAVGSRAKSPVSLAQAPDQRGAFWRWIATSRFRQFPGEEARG